MSLVVNVWPIKWSSFRLTNTYGSLTTVVDNFGKTDRATGKHQPIVDQSEPSDVRSMW